MSSSGTDPSDNDMCESSHYLSKKWNKKLLAEEPSIRRPRSETVPTQFSNNININNNNIRSPFGNGVFNAELTPWNDTIGSPNSDRLLDENHHAIASTFASLGLDEDRPLDTKRIHTSQSYSSLQLLAENQHDLIRPPPSVMDLRLNRPRAQSAVDHRPSEPSYQHIWQPELRYIRQPIPERRVRTSNSSADLLEAIAQQRKVVNTSGSSGYIDEKTEPWELSNSLTDLIDVTGNTSAQVPSRSLWIGQLDSTITTNDLSALFSKFGTIDSLRTLPDRECAFINYLSIDEALRAKDYLVNKMGCQLGKTTVKVGFGKPEAVLQLCMENVQDPTRALWLGNIPNNTTHAMLANIFSAFGAIESIRVLPHKNCGFINFFNSEDAVRAKRALQNREIMGPGSGMVKIGFAKVPALKNVEDDVFPEQKEAHQQEVMMYMMTEMMNNPKMMSAIVAERKMIMQDFGDDKNDGPNFHVLHLPQKYFHTIPAAPELGQSRQVDTSRLREIKRRLDTGHISLAELELIAMECLDEMVELCSDYIGNTVIQRLFERCSEMSKSVMVGKVAPYLGSIGVHKNGTWAAQKIIDTAKVPTQIALICEHIKPFVPALLLDKFGNYVVQCCLTLGPTQNQFIFDAIVDSCWEIAQGRFGARAVRATLESPHVTKRQQKYVAASLVQHALLLSTNANGALLLIWLLDTSGIPGRYRVLAPRLLPHLARLCTHKLASLTVLKLVNQRQEPDARNLILDALFFAPQGTDVIEEILHDQVHGVSLIQKILSSSYIDLRERQRIAERVKQILHKLKLQHVQGYKRLIEEINMVMADSVPGASLSAGIPSQFSISPSLAAALKAKYLSVNNLGGEDTLDPQSTAAMMTNFYAAAAAASIATTNNEKEEKIDQENI